VGNSRGARKLARPPHVNQKKKKKKKKKKRNQAADSAEMTELLGKSLGGS